MTALSFLFQPWSAALSHLAHLLALLAALAAVATSRQRALSSVLLLAALSWAVVVVLSAIIASLPPGTTPPSYLAWAPIATDLPAWAAVVAGLLALWRSPADHRGRRWPPGR